MPTTLSTLNPLTGEVKVRYKETYITEGLNSKFAGVVPRGIHRGFRLGTSGVALTIQVRADLVTNDHVAQYLTSNGQALTLRRTGGTFSVALSASNTHIIALYATYSTSTATAADLRSYTLAEYNALSASARDELVVLGTVVTPGSGAIPEASITHDRRVEASTQRSPEANAWIPLIGDPSFELAEVGAVPFGWSVSTDANALYSSVNTDPSGWRALEFEAATPATPITVSLYYPVMVPVEGSLTLGDSLYGSGYQDVHIRLAFKNIQGATGNLIAQPLFRDTDGATVSPGDSLAIITTSSSPDGAYVFFEKTFRVPTGARMLTAIAITGTLTYASAAVGFHLRQVQAWLKQPPARKGLAEIAGQRPILTNSIRFAKAEGEALAATDPVFERFGDNVSLRRASGAGIDPNLILLGGVSFRSARSVNSDVTLDVDDTIILVDNTASRNLTLPSPTNRPFYIVRALGLAGTNPITLVRAGAEKINGLAASYELNADYGTWVVFSDGTDWYTF